VTRSDRWIALGLALLTIAAFEGVTRCGFVTFDDGAYAAHNPIVAQGLTAHGFGWALTTFHSSNWHPLTWLSLMLDVSLFGPGPLGHHVVSVLLHAASVVVLYLGLARASGARGASALAAALFAVHPLRVESVAWIAERKDVLCTFFYLAAVVLYGARRLGWSLAAFALALLAKPMAVTLPLALLIVDFWPLGRKLDVARVRETWAFFALAGLSCAITLWAQLSTGATEAWIRPSFAERLTYVPLEYVRYIRLFLWPSGLAVLYPRPAGSLIVESLLSLALLGALAWLVIVQGRTRPWLVAGLVWFAVTLVPVLGIVHVGFQGVADRYTYIPAIGLSVLVAFRAAELADRARMPRAARAAASFAVLAALAFLTHRQVEFWRDGESLYERALAVTKDNFAIHAFLADDLADGGRRAEAYEHYREALRIRPDFPHAHYGIGVMYEEDGKPGEAMSEYRAALAANPDFAEAHFNLANLLGRAGALDEAISHYRRVLELQPSHEEARRGLAIAESLAPRQRR
jgi:tetratricopeptide (TPR) repeat protein